MRFASTSAPIATSAISRAGTLGWGTASIAGEEVPEPASRGDTEWYADHDSDADRDRRLPGDDRGELPAGEAQRLE